MTRDLSRFTEDNERWRNQHKRVPWAQRLELIQETFPSTRTANWDDILKDPDILARVFKDILKVDQMEPGRAGPRPNLDVERGMQVWNEFATGDFAERPFPEAFRLLTRNASIRSVAHKINISKSRVERLLNGRDHPTIEDLRLIAAAYNKKPAYFIEYRAEYIIAVIAAQLADRHEMTVALYKKLVRAL